MVCVGRQIGKAFGNVCAVDFAAVGAGIGSGLAGGEFFGNGITTFVQCGFQNAQFLGFLQGKCQPGVQVGFVWLSVFSSTDKSNGVCNSEQELEIHKRSPSLAFRGSTVSKTLFRLARQMLRPSITPADRTLS